MARELGDANGVGTDQASGNVCRIVTILIVSWDSAEVPSMLNPYGNTVPSSPPKLPPSFYLTAKPSWWVLPSGTTATFPGIGPDVTGGNIPNVGGHAYLRPAANCYLNVMGGTTDGSSGVLTFDPSSCYQ